MRFEIDATDVLARSDGMHRAGERLLEDLERRLVTRGHEATRFAQRRYRTGAPYTTETRTARRSGGLYDAYDSAVEAVSTGRQRGFDLHLGGIKPGEDAEVLRRFRIHEGYDASGTRVEQFEIVPRNGDFLVFRLPPEKGGQWVSVRKVTLKPRPTFPAILEMLPPYLEQDVGDAWRQVLVQ